MKKIKVRPRWISSYRGKVFNPYIGKKRDYSFGNNVPMNDISAWHPKMFADENT